MKTQAQMEPDYLVRKDKSGTYLVTKWEGGNEPTAIYTVTDSNRGMSCNCPGSRRDKNCKHVQLVKEYIKKPNETISKIVNSTMIGLVVESSMVRKFQKDLTKFLEEYRPQAINDLHVTLALIPQAQTHELDDALKDVATFEPEFRTLDLELLPGKDFDYLVFKLQPDSHFKELIDLLKMTVNAKVRPDFIPHVSIMKFPHGTFEEVSAKIDSLRVPSFNLAPTSVGIWNSSFNMFKESRI